MTSFYVGPNRPPLTLDTWNDIVAAVQGGSTHETQWFELKKDVPAEAEKANDELAKDLASLTVDGGLLLIGVKDGATAAADAVGLNPDKIESLSTRISQIAGGPRIVPAMHVVLHSIDNPDGSGLAVLAVEVPASPTAPHMVDGRYWGRSADGKRALSDSEVARLMTRREEGSDRFLAELADMAETVDWLPEHERTRGRLYVMARPVAGAHDLGDALRDKHMFEVIVPTLAVHRPAWATGFESMNHQLALSDGIAAASEALDRSSPARERYLAFLQILNDSTIKFANGYAVVPFKGDEPCISLPGIAESVQQTALLASHLAKSYLNYGGDWRLGIRATGLAGLYPSLHYSQSNLWGDLRPYTANVFERNAVVTLAQLSSPSSAVVEAVLSPLARALKLDRKYFPYDHVGELEKKNR